MNSTFPLLALLVGCVGTYDGDTTAADSSADSAIDAPPCDLSHPWAMDTVDHVGVAAGLAYPDVVRVVLLDQNAMSGARVAASDGDPCPTYTESNDGTAIAVAGDCTTSWGSVYGGTATFTDVDGSSSAVYDRFHFEDGLNPYGYDVDGSWLEEDGELTFDLTATLLGDWGLTSLAGATVFHSARFTSDDGSNIRVEGYADILSQPTSDATGDLCVVADDYFSYDASCDSEPDEVLTLWGSTPATLTWNGSTACDGCADVTIDGADAGSYCP